MPNVWNIPKDGPEPTMEKCIRCKGKGYFYSEGFTSNASRNKGECYLCHGRGEYPSNYYIKCFKCTGRGHFFSKGVCAPWTKGQEPCTACEGGYIRLENPDNELRPIACLMCKGLGHFSYKGWRHQGNKQWNKGLCPCCEGKGNLIGNYSRCKRCKGKGCFGKKGVISAFNDPKFIIKNCEDCEGKGFIKEEEPVEEDDSGSVSSDEDSEKKNQQPDDEPDYNGQQPEDDGNYGGDQPESEEPEPVDPTPEPDFTTCARCSGKGFYGGSGWTKNEKTSKGKCPLCEGKAVYPKNLYRECLKCKTKGYFSPTVSPTTIWSKLGLPCSNCQGVGFNKINFYEPIEDQEKCQMCKGKGHYGNVGWCFQEQKVKQGDCPCCEGSGTMYGDWEKCKTCKGKGGFKGKNPNFPYQKSKERDCDDCNGKGYNKQEKEEKENNNKKLKPKKKELVHSTENSQDSSNEQPQNNGGYGGNQPKESGGYGGNQPQQEENEQEQEEPKQEEEQVEEKEPEKEPTPEPDDGLSVCVRCEGKGAYNAFGWCEPSKPNKKGDCPVCDGKGRYDPALFRKCNKCEGNGAFNASGYTKLWNTFKTKQPCSSCNLVGYLATRPETQLKEQECLLCGGLGHYNSFRFCKQHKRKENCPLCLGKGELYGDYEKCNKCEGKGCTNQMGPCEVYKQSPSKEPCDECNGKGYSRSEEQDKLELEEKEKYGYDVSIQFDIGEPPEVPEGEGCCIIL